MNLALTLILTVQMLTALGMIGLILVQHGKGADMGAAFGSGGSGSLFGASGSSNFLSRTTAVLAAVSGALGEPRGVSAMARPMANASARPRTHFQRGARPSVPGMAVVQGGRGSRAG